jgi:hypothetical protein
MALTDAELFMQAVDLDDTRHALLEQALHDMPGVRFVSQRAYRSSTAEVSVQIAFDPQITNPVIIKEELGRQGFTILSARESDTADELV